MHPKRSKWWRLDTSERARARILFQGRTPNRNPLWSEKEDQVIRDLFPNYAEINKQLRRRKIGAIRSRAHKLKLSRPAHPWTVNEVSRLRRLWRDATRAELMTEFPHRSWCAIQGKGKTFGLRRRPWKPKVTGESMLDQIRQRAADLRISLADLDRMCVGRRGDSRSAWSERPSHRNRSLRQHRVVHLPEGLCLRSPPRREGRP